MSRSSLVDYIQISPNKTSPRNHKIDTITIHCYVGQASIESMASWLCNPSAEASANYGIGNDGRIVLLVDEEDRSWCSSNAFNDNRAVTIECASDTIDPYAINDQVYRSLIELCADICKRNNIKELKWRGDSSLIGQVDKQNMTVHRWFANKACPGDYIYNRLGTIAFEVNKKLNVKPNPLVHLQGSMFRKMSNDDVIKKVGPLFTNDQNKSGILASVSLAQFILESGYGKSELTQKANNCFGMKTSLSGNTWPNSTWDGKSKYTKITKESYDGKNFVEVKADFRKYSTIEKSISDHSAYLLGAMNGTKKRYDGLKGCKDYRKAISIIKNGGYATDPNYIEKICKLIKDRNLTQYDSTVPFTEEEKWYRVRKSWEDASSQINAYHDLTLAKKCADENIGYFVFDESGQAIYPSEDISSKKSFNVKIDVTDLNIRTGPGIEYSKTGHYTEIGVFTITEVKSGKGSNKGWGKLKSGAGWISLDFAKRI